MSIIVGKIENKFWSNSDYKFPNGFPVYDEQEELKDVQPNMNNFMTGTVYLFGDHWNHCIYNGSYYSLYIFQVIDESRKFYCYRLERDFWFDVLKARPAVVGDLITSNNDELLEKHLNRTISALDNPARVVTINFGEVDFDWRKNFEFKPADKPISQKVLTIDDFNSFIESAECVFATKWKDIDKAFYSKEKNPAVFLIDLLQPSITLTGWKNILRNKLNDFIKSIPKTDKTKLKIGKVTFTGKNSSSGLVGKYCITQKVEGIAEAGESENYKIKKIDLSTLEDIVPVNIHDLQEVTPYTNLLKGAKSGLFQQVDRRHKREKFFGKIKRKAYVPICSSSERRPVDIGFGYSGNWNNVNNPQKVTWEYGGVTVTDYLWWVDNLNFAIQRTGFDVGVGIGYNAHFVFKEQWATSISPFPIPWTLGKIFPELTNDEIVSFGFLIYKLSRPNDVWYLFEYKGGRNLRNVEYISGIKKFFVENYRNETKKWWSNFPHQFRQTRHSDELIKFYLDNYMLAIMTLLPGSYYTSDFTAGSSIFPNYLYTDLWGTYLMTKYKYYIPQIIVSDIYNEQGRSVATNPYNSSRYEGYVRERDRKFQTLLNHSFVELPEGVEIEDGDYFFSDLDYEIETRFVPQTGKEKGKEWFNFTENKYLGWNTFRDFIDQMRLEDFVRLDSGTEILRLEPNEDAFALCTTLRGNIDVRKIQSFNQTLRISTEEDEIVQEVEGSKSRNVTFTLLKKLSEPLIPEQGEYRITEQIKAKIIRAFYESIGYKVVGEGEVFWNWFDESDFAETCQDQLLFDLKGTDWYCFITKGKISLICKDETLLEATETKLTSLLYHENKDLNLSLIEKVNQKTRLQFYTAPYYLNWKTRFNEEDKIFLYSTLIKPTVQQTQFEQHFLRLDTGFDRIWYENITIPKKVDKALALADSLAVQKAHLDLIKDQYTYQIDQDRLALATKRYEENIKRSQIELDIQRKESILSAGLSLVTGGLGAGLSSRLKQIPQALGQEWVPTQGEPYYEVPLVPGTQYVNIEQFKRFTTVMQPKITGLGKAGGLALGAAGFAVGGALKAAKGLISDFAFRFPEMERQLGVEKQLGAEQIGLRSLTINTQHMERQLKTQHSLNQMSNMYHNPFINEREILDQYNAKQEWHGKKLKDIYLVVFIPSEEQLIALRNYKEEFGVMCDIPNITTNFFEGMEPDFIRYRNLDDAAIQGIENLWVRDFFKSHLLAGVKIVKITPKVQILLTTDEYRQQILRLNKDLFKTTENVKELEGKILVIRGECEEKANKEIEQIKEKCGIEKTQLERQLNQIENQLNNINTQLNEKVKELEAKEKECTDTKKKLEEEIKKHKIDKEEAEQKWDNCKRDYLNEKDEKNRLLKQKEESDKQLAEYEEDKKRLAWNRKELANKRKELEDVTKAKQLLETEKAALIKEYEQERDDRLSALKELRNSEGEREKLEKEKEDLEKQKELLETQKSDIERQLRESLEAKKTLETQKAEVQKKFEDCKKNRQQQKAQLEGKIKDLQEKLTAASAAPTPPPVYREPRGFCELLKSYFANPLNIDLKPRETDGGNALRDLIIEVIKEVSWMRKASLDAKLGAKYPSMRPIFETLMRFEEIPVVAKWEEVMGHRQWPMYIHYKKRGGVVPDAIRPVLAMIDTITGATSAGALSMENSTAAHAIKVILDELNWLTYRAKEQFREQLKTDEDLNYFFAHIYPGESLNLYNALYGDHNIYLAKRKYIEDVTCGGGTLKTADILLDYKKRVKYDTTGFIRQPERKLPTSPGPVYQGKQITSDDKDIKPGGMMQSYRIESSKHTWNSEFPNKNFSLIYAKFPGIEGSEYRAYINVEEEDILEKIFNIRNALWSSRKTYLSKHIDLSKVKPGTAFYLSIENFVAKNNRIEVDRPEGSEGSGWQDLKFFGEKNLWDAAILFAILFSNRLKAKESVDSRGNRWISISRFKTSSTALVDNVTPFPQLFQSEGWRYLTDFPDWNDFTFYFEFLDFRSMFTYIWRHISVDATSLGDTFTSYSGSSVINFRKFLNDIWKANNS